MTDPDPDEAVGVCVWHKYYDTPMFPRVLRASNVMLDEANNRTSAEEVQRLKLHASARPRPWPQLPAEEFSDRAS